MRCTADDQLAVVDAAVIGAGDGAQLRPAIAGLERLDLLGAVRAQAVLQVDAGERCRELAQVARRRADQRRELAEAPMRRSDRRLGAGQHQREPLGVVPAGFDPHRGTLDRPGPAPLGAAVHRREQLRQGQEALIRRAREPLGRNPADPLPSRDIHLVAARRTLLDGPAHRISLIADLRDGPAESLSLDPQPVTATAAALYLSKSSTRHGHKKRTPPCNDKRVTPCYDEFGKEGLP